MISRIYKLIALAAAFVLLGLLQPATSRADEASRGIGGTGHAATESGVGGTGDKLDTQGIGGTGHAINDSGIGGTGIVAGNKTGIGGTGHGDGGIGGTGIVGIVTGFGSIWVNGLEVQYDAKTQVAGNTGTVSTNELAIGQVVVIEAQGSDNALQANKISVVNAVAGQISALEDGKLTVLGQAVVISPQTLTRDPLNQSGVAQLHQGDHIKVSGLRLANGEIVASRIERTAAIAEPALVGAITGINGNMIEMNGLQISTSSTSGLSVGQEIAVVGQMNGSVLTAREITPSPSTQLYGRTEHIKLQGYVGSRSAEGQIKVGNLEVAVPDPSIISGGKLDALNPGELIQISGHFASDRRVIAERIEFSRDRLDRVMHDHASRRERSDKAERAEHSGHGDRPDRNDHVDRPERPDRSEHSEAEKHSGHSH